LDEKSVLFLTFHESSGSVLRTLFSLFRKTIGNQGTLFYGASDHQKQEIKARPPETLRKCCPGPHFYFR